MVQRSAIFTGKNLAVRHVLPRQNATSLRRFGSFLVAIAVICLFSLQGCSRGLSKNLNLPPDPSFSSEIGWALVVSAYAKVKNEPKADSNDISLIRSGTLFEVEERRIDPLGQEEGGLWYKYKDSALSGWIHSADLSVFSSVDQAKKAAENYRLP